MSEILDKEATDENWIQTYSGLRFNFFNLKPDMVSVVDIAHALSNMCRFNGHTHTYYSVAEHSILLSRYVLETTGDRHKARNMLFHDATEAYLCDIPRPIKMNLPDYRALEKTIEKFIAQLYNLSYPHEDWLKELDNRMLKTEKYQVLSVTDIPWACDSLEVLPITIEFLKPEEAEYEFLNMFKELS